MKNITLAVLLTIATSAVSAEPMWFKSVSNGGNCGGCAWTIAQGEITKDTPDALRAFLEERGRPAEFVFESKGGNLGAALEMGRIIRNSNSSTSIGRSVQLDGTPWFDMKAGGICNSACAFAFFAGTSRSAYQGDDSSMVPRTGTLGMHQFFTPSGHDIPTAQTQQIIGQILLYVLEMGINAEILSIASQTPADDMYVFTRNELVRMGLLTAAQTLPLELVVDDEGALVAQWRTFRSNGAPERDVQLLCRNDDWVVRTFQHENQNYFDGQLDVMRENGVHFALDGDTRRISGADVLSFSKRAAGSVMEVRLPVDPRNHPGQSLSINPFAARNFWMVNAAAEPLPDAKTMAALARSCR